MNKSSKKSTVTIQDIADKLKIATSTVSRALKNNSRISEKTKKEVWHTAQKLGYKHNTTNYFHNNNTPKNIGIIIPELNNHLYTDTIKRIQKDARIEGYNTIVSYSNGSTEIEKEIVENFIKLNLDGIIISLVETSLKQDYLDDIIISGIPMVCINNVNFDLPVPKIILDSYQGTYKAVKHLISVGCKKVALLLGDDESVDNSKILNGYKTGLSSSGVPCEKDLIIRCKLTDPFIEYALEPYFSKGSFPDAVITANYFSALYTISYLKSINIRVPGDVSIISYGSDPNHKLYSPSITSINYSANDFGKSALKQLLELIQKRKDGVQFSEKTIITPAKLVIRGSSMRD
jgi:LacI family transcriptional regulator